jgi:hypothetical protein
VHEVVQHAEIEIHPDLVKHRLKPGVERLTVLAYHQGGPDGAQALGRTGRPPGRKSCGCAVILASPPSRRVYGAKVRRPVIREPGGDSGLLREAGEARHAAAAFGPAAASRPGLRP